jgi:hypothetical protein
LVAQLAIDPPANGREKPRRHVRSRPQLLNRRDLDHRRNSVAAFDRLVNAITTDLSGGKELSHIQMQLIEAFAGAAIALDSLNARILLGEQVSLAEHAKACSAMVRLATRLGLKRRAHDVTPPTLEDSLVANYQRLMSEDED